MIIAETTVREIALEQPESIRVFEKFGIDYCCGGRKPLAEACAERSIALEAVLEALENAGQVPENLAPDWTKAPLGDLCSHIVAEHHEYVRQEIPRLQQLARRVVVRHGSDRTELGEIEQQVADLSEELLQHINKEELMLFPYITKLERSLAAGTPLPVNCFGTVKNPIRAMMAEHDSVGEEMAQIRVLSGNYTPPEGACPTFRGFYQALSEFESDLHRHVHLENNILFLRAIELEDSCN